jgi:hypothetical protein
MSRPIPQNTAAAAYPTAWAAYNTAWATHNTVYDEKQVTVDKMQMVHRKKWAVYCEVYDAVKSAIEVLHAIECPDCPWNGQTILP